MGSSHQCLSCSSQQTNDTFPNVTILSTLENLKSIQVPVGLCPLFNDFVLRNKSLPSMLLMPQAYSSSEQFGHVSQYPRDFEITGLTKEVILPHRVTKVPGTPMRQEFRGLEIVLEDSLGRNENKQKQTESRVS